MVISQRPRAADSTLQIVCSDEHFGSAVSSIHSVTHQDATYLIATGGLGTIRVYLISENGAVVDMRKLSFSHEAKTVEDQRRITASHLVPLNDGTWILVTGHSDGQIKVNHLTLYPSHDSN